MYNLKKGLNIPISGTPEGNVSDSTKISHVGILGPDYVGMKPTMMVEIGDEVQIGSASVSYTHLTLPTRTRV